MGPYRELEKVDVVTRCEGCGRDVDARVTRCGTCKQLEEMRKSILWVRLAPLVLVGLLGCGGEGGPPAMWHGDVRFTAEERSAIVEGEAWIAAQGGHPPGGVVFDGVVGVRSIRRELGSVPVGTVRPTGECVDGGLYLFPDARPEINAPALTMPLLAGLTAHEMAHCRYGFVDAYHPGDPSSDGIMRVLAPMRWTSAEEAQCEKTRCRDASR